MRDIDVVIPARNAGRTVAATIDSLGSVAPLIGALIVVDDGSRDDTAEAARAAAQALGVPCHILRGPETGVGAARNLGAAAGVSPYVYFLDADDLVLARGLAQLRDRLEADPGADLAIGVCIDRSPAGDQPHPALEGDEDALRLAERYINFEVPLIRPGSALVRRSALAGCAFPERCPVGEDGVFWAQVLSHARVCRSDEPVIVYAVDASRYDARYLRHPRAAFLGFARAARRLGRRGLSRRELRRARGRMAALFLKRLLAHRRPEAGSFFRVVCASGLQPRRAFGIARDLIKTRRPDMALQLALRATRWMVGR